MFKFRAKFLGVRYRQWAEQRVCAQWLNWQSSVQKSNRCIGTHFYKVRRKWRNKSSFGDVNGALCGWHCCWPSCSLSETNRMTVLLNGTRSLSPRPSGSLSINDKRWQTLSAGHRRCTQPDEWPPELHFTKNKAALLYRLRHLKHPTKQWSSCSVTFNLESVLNVPVTSCKPVYFDGHRVQSSNIWW